MKIREIRKAQLTAREWRKLISELSIWKLMWGVRMASWNDFVQDIGDLAGSFGDMLEGLLDTVRALGRVLRVLMAYAVWPISKPIVAAYWRRRFRRDEREKAKPEGMV